MEKSLKEIAKELRLIRLELEQMNGVQITEGGPKVNLKEIARVAERRKRAEGTMMKGV